MSETDGIQRDEVKKLQARAHGMLPGVAGICLFLLFFTMVNVYGALQNVYGTGFGKYGVLTICTLLAVGIFGLLRLRRWGWALVLAGCLLVASGDMYFFSKRHVTFFLIRGLFELVFFLYLVRVEVRDRLR
jgi:uncharacterized membrane protein